MGGISAYAAEQLGGDITFVELPDVDDETEKGEVYCSIESVKPQATFMHLCPV